MSAAQAPTVEVQSSSHVVGERHSSQAPDGHPTLMPRLDASLEEVTYRCIRYDGNMYET